MYSHQLTTLKNGLRLVTVPIPSLESTTVMVGVGAGSRFETKKINGIFHFLEHMAFKGTVKRPTAQDIALEVDSVGGEFNAFTGKELTGYYVKLASQHQALAFDILADILTNSVFNPREIRKEKGVIIEEINMFEDSPTRKILREFVRLLYGDNAMGWCISGTKNSVLGLKRHDFLNCLDRYYSSANMAVIVAGKLDQKQIEKTTDRYFGGLKRSGKKAGVKAGPIQKKARLKLIYKKTEQAHFCLGVPAYSLSHPDRFALGVLAGVLGGGMSSRLFTEVREKRGLAYYVDCSPDYFTDSGYFLARAGVKLKQVEEALKIVLNEFRTLVSVKVAAKELDKAKEFLKGRLILALEDSQNVASRYVAQVLLENKIRTPKQVLAEIDKIKTEDVQRVAKDIFRSERLNLALIGPLNNSKALEKIIVV